MCPVTPTFTGWRFFDADAWQRKAEPLRLYLLCKLSADQQFTKSITVIGNLNWHVRRRPVHNGPLVRMQWQDEQTEL
jgi:hypothetical protein